VNAGAPILDGKRVLITGGSRGLGRAMALGMAQAGADLVLVSRKIEACREAAASIAEETGRDVGALACHVGHWEECGRLVEDAWNQFGRIDTLVNNAGMSPAYDKLTDVTEELYDKTFAVNAKGPFRLTAVFAERMYEAGGGSIINVSSIGAVKPRPDVVPYSGAKAALNAMTMGFAMAYGPLVRVNVIAPGPFLTDISANWESAYEERAAAAPMGRIGRPEEIVGAAIYLASDASSFTTASILTVDGGGSL
jgi:NAD(P)-dependent dehydrogenase (short-subunit alcohol dehydrogenase family)